MSYEVDALLLVLFNMRLTRPNGSGRAAVIARLLRGSLLTCVVIGGAACQDSRKPEPPVTKARPEAKRVLGYFNPVAGTSYLMAPINSTTGGSSYKYDGDREAHNYVFFNTADESTLTLLPNNDHLFVATVSLPERHDGDKEAPPVKWFLYSLVTSDTDGDKELTYKDRRTLCVSDAGGVGFKELLTDVEQVYGQTLHDADTLLIIYRKGAKTYVTRINLPNRQVVSTKELPSFGVTE